MANDLDSTYINSERSLACQAPQERSKTAKAAKDIRFGNGYRYKEWLPFIYSSAQALIQLPGLPFLLKNKKKEIQTIINWEKEQKKPKTHTHTPIGTKHFIYFFKGTTAIYMIAELWSTVKQKEWNGLGPSTNDLTPSPSYWYHSEKLHYLKRKKI